MFYVILYSWPNNIKCTFTVFIYLCLLFIIPSQSVLAKVLPNLWQRRLEKPLLMQNNMFSSARFQTDDTSIRGKNWDFSGRIDSTMQLSPLCSWYWSLQVYWNCWHLTQDGSTAMVYFRLRISNQIWMRIHIYPWPICHCSFGWTSW